MKNINPYLLFAGNTEEAFNFYKSILGGEFRTIQRFKDTPDGNKLSESEGNKIMHIALPIGKENILMGTDDQSITSGTNFKLTLAPDSKEEADKVFGGLAEGGKVTLPMQDMFWGDYFGMLTDKFGIQWIINYSKQEQAQ